jgi:hypothetical protein
VLLNDHRANGMVLCSEVSRVHKESHSARRTLCRFIVVCCFVFRVHCCSYCEYIAVCITGKLLFILDYIAVSVLNKLLFIFRVESCFVGLA